LQKSLSLSRLILFFKGIGLAIVRNLALQYPKSRFNKGPFLVYLTARSKERGEEAVKSLQKDDQLAQAKALRQDGGLTEVKYQSLDISSTASIQALREYLKKEHPEGIDILVNNAGIAMEGFSMTQTHNIFTSTNETRF
jgi:carbonyl reductase 1